MNKGEVARTGSEGILRIIGSHSLRGRVSFDFPSAGRYVLAYMKLVIAFSDYIEKPAIRFSESSTEVQHLAYEGPKRPGR